MPFNPHADSFELVMNKLDKSKNIKNPTEVTDGEVRGGMKERENNQYSEFVLQLVV